jgi:hypothetical protein
LAFNASVTGMLRSVSALNCRQKPARMPYSCQDQFGTSGNSGCPIGGLSTVRGIAFSIRHSSTLRITHTASFLPSGSLSLGRSICAW